MNMTGLKIKDLGVRNKNLEKELQEKLFDIIEDPKYRDLPMLLINGLSLSFGTKKDVILDISNSKYYFIISRNIFDGKKK